MNVPTFQEARENGESINKEGYHKPNSQGFRHKNCGCKKTTEKGAYRDRSFEMPNGLVVHFYHQTPVVASKNGKYWLNNGGYKTSTTKERINRYCPFRVFQEDYDWYVNYQNERIDFENGMILEE